MSEREHDRLDPVAVAARLAALGERWRPLTADEAHALMTPPTTAEPFAIGVARRLDELRALLELTRHLHGRGVSQATNASKRSRLA